MPGSHAGQEAPLPEADGGDALVLEAGFLVPSLAALPGEGGSLAEGASHAVGVSHMMELAVGDSLTEDRGPCRRRTGEGGDAKAAGRLCLVEGAPSVDHFRCHPKWGASSWIGTRTGRALASSGTRRPVTDCGVPSWAFLPSFSAWTAPIQEKRNRSPCSVR